MVNNFSKLQAKHQWSIGFLLVDDFALMSYAAVCEPFRAANLLAGKTLFSLYNFSLTGEKSVSSNGCNVLSVGDITKSHSLDILFVVAGGDTRKYDYSKLTKILRRIAQNGVLLGGVSAGPLILAKAGLMQGRRMTVHWEHLPILKEMATGAIVERSLFVIDRDRITCAGGIAPMDMTYSLIAQNQGADFARSVSDWFLYTQIRPSQSEQRSSLIDRYKTSNKIVIDTLELMRNHIGDPLSLDQLASLGQISKRQLNRLFKDEVGHSTMQVYTQLRLDNAARLIKNSTLSITEIAYATGFTNSAHFAYSFKAKYKMTPSKFKNKH